MQRLASTITLTLSLLVPGGTAFPQAFGEYGRVVGGIPQGLGPRAPGGSSSQGVVGGDVGGVSGPALPSRLVVSIDDALLYPRQDDESESIGVLARGEALTPMMQSGAANDWFMVKTQKGLVGWVRAASVRIETAKK